MESKAIDDGETGCAGYRPSGQEMSFPLQIRAPTLARRCVGFVTIAVMR